MRNLFLILCVSVYLAGCMVFYPKKIVHHNGIDKECALIQKELLLDKVTYGKVSDWLQPLPGAYHCNGEDCLFLLLPAIAAASTTASTFLISGSIVIVGNAVYWLEKKAECAQNEAQREYKTVEDF